MGNKNLSEREYFIQACFSKDLQKFYHEYISLSRGRIQFFNIGKDGRLEHKYWIPGNKCCESDIELSLENIDIKVGYWRPNVWKPILKELKTASMKFESLECQNIDCSCNDCIYLERALKLCNKFNKEIFINPNMCDSRNLKCFEHRRNLKL